MVFECFSLESKTQFTEWFKQKIIIENTINFGFKGWMADFGEYLPYSEDALFWDGNDGRHWHNKYPERWAHLNWEALGKFLILKKNKNTYLNTSVETGTVGDCFYFSRAGWNGMRSSSTSAWAGDQNVDFRFVNFTGRSRLLLEVFYHFSSLPKKF